MISDRVYEEIEKAEPAIALALVRNIVDGPTFDEFQCRVAAYARRYPYEAMAEEVAIVDRAAKEWIGHIPVAVLTDLARRELLRPQNTKSRPACLVRLSAETALKQLARHPDITAEHYRRLPDLIEHGRFKVESERRLVFYGRFERRWFRSVVKQTTYTNEIYLTAYHRVHPDQVPESIRRETISEEREAAHGGAPNSKQMPGNPT